MEAPIRVLIAKPGLDGHDRGAKVVALALRDAGFEVLYSGLHQTVPAIVEAALDEDVDVIGLSILSGAHLPIARSLMAALKRSQAQPSAAGSQEQEVDDKLVLIGGNIPAQDIAALKELGVAAVFPTGSSLTEVVEFIRKSK